MSTFDISELLKLTDEVLKNKKKEFIRPERALIWFNFLVPKGWTQTTDLDHFYLAVPTLSYQPKGHMVIHGHDKHKLCFAPDYCHLINYRPGPEYNPSFRKQFERKWEGYYS